MVTFERVRDLVRGAVRAPEEVIHGATADELAALEQRLGRSLPTQLREFLRVCNGARIGPGGLFGHRPNDPSCDLPSFLALWREWAVSGWLPVAGAGCGNYYVMTPDGAVGFVDTMADPGALEGTPFPDLFACVEALLANDQAAP